MYHVAMREDTPYK